LEALYSISIPLSTFHTKQQRWSFTRPHEIQLLPIPILNWQHSLLLKHTSKIKTIPIPHLSTTFLFLKWEHKKVSEESTYLSNIRKIDIPDSFAFRNIRFYFGPLNT